jgi:hypothetical protein
LTDE